MAKVSASLKNTAEYTEYMRLAHRADQRLLRLEKYSEQEYFKGSTEYAYKYAEKTIKDLQGGSRFRSVAIRNEQELRAATAGVKKFLEAPSSTKQGIISVYKKRADSVNARFGTNLTWQEMADAWEYIDSQKEGSVNYRSIFRTFDKLKKEKEPEDVLQQILDGSFKNTHKTLSTMEKKIIKELGQDIIEKLILKL